MALGILYLRNVGSTKPKWLNISQPDRLQQGNWNNSNSKSLV